MKLISIIVPCFNQAQYLDECLQSVFNQTYQHWECIIVNDGSPDNTFAVAQIWLEKDARFKYLEKQNGGLSSARNAGIESANGEFILPLDADDRIGTQYCELAMTEFKLDSELKIVYCRANKFGDEKGEWLLNPFSLEKICTKNMIFCSAFFKKNDWQIVGGYDVKMIYGWEDWEFWIAVLKNGGNVKRLNFVGFYYRIKLKSMLKSISLENQIYLQKYISIKHADFFVAHLGSFNELIYQNKHFKKMDYRLLTNKKKALKVVLHAYFGINYFK
jgi:glycosyltransferase involved in cell wall biosynthesis